MRKYFKAVGLISISALLAAFFVSCSGGGDDSGSSSNWPAKVGVTSKDRARAMASDSAGNTYVTGYTQGAFPGYTNAGDRDMYVVKVDPNGNVLWTRQAGTSGRDIGMGIAVGSDGAVYVSGLSPADISAVARHVEGHYNGFLMKLNGSTGAVEKTVMYGDNISEHALFYDLAMGQNGALCAAGTIISTSANTGLVACYDQNLVLTADKRMDDYYSCHNVDIGDNGSVAVSCSTEDKYLCGQRGGMTANETARGCSGSSTPTPTPTPIPIPISTSVTYSLMLLSGNLEFIITHVALGDFFTAINTLFLFGNNMLVGVADDGIAVADTNTGTSTKIGLPNGAKGAYGAKYSSGKLVLAIEYDDNKVDFYNTYGARFSRAWGNPDNWNDVDWDTFFDFFDGLSNTQLNELINADQVIVIIENLTEEELEDILVDYVAENGIPPFNSPFGTSQLPDNTTIQEIIPADAPGDSDVDPPTIDFLTNPELGADGNPIDDSIVPELTPIVTIA